MALCLLWPIAANAQQPFVVDDAEVTAPRIWHVELSTQVDLLRSTARPALWQTTTDTELDVGVAPRVELAVLVPLIGLVSETPDGRRLAAGIGDTSFGAKMRFTKSPDARHAFAGSVSIEVPSGDRQRELGSGLVDYGVNLISQHRLDYGGRHGSMSGSCWLAIRKPARSESRNAAPSSSAAAR